MRWSDLMRMATIRRMDRNEDEESNSKSKLVKLKKCGK